MLKQCVWSNIVHHRFTQMRIESKQNLMLRRFCTKKQLKLGASSNAIRRKLEMPEPEYNLKFLCDPSNRDLILNNIKLRRSTGDIDKVIELSKQHGERKEFLKELRKLPNSTDESVLEYGEEPKVLKIIGNKSKFDFVPQEFRDIAKNLKLMKTEALGPLIGQRGYIFFGDLANLEDALTYYTIKKLTKSGFKLISVPDIVPTEVIERCGSIMDKEKSLVYRLDPTYGTDLSLSATAEIALAGKLINAELSYKDLPLKMCAVSRCFRAEVSNMNEERGIYRVHQFTKVEMFVCTEPDKSREQFQDICTIQEDIFSSLGLHFRIMDMPPHELGSPASRKVDMEGWMPGRKQYGELSSCSNCTDYQSRRLNIKYKNEKGELAHVHTLNGTACAMPRMLISLCETHQTKHMRITVPEVLKPYFKGQNLIKKQPVPYMRIYKYKPKIN